MADADVPSAFSPVWKDDSRGMPLSVGGEREVLCSYLDWHRATFELKCSGVPSDDAPNQDFDDLDGDVVEALALWHAECERSREIVTAAHSLDETCTRRSTGEPIALRSILVNLIAEYARHNGHADLLRERIDGATGM